MIASTKSENELSMRFFHSPNIYWVPRWCTGTIFGARNTVIISIERKVVLIRAGSDLEQPHLVKFGVRL